VADPLPIDAVLPELVAALRAEGQAVLQAPPGAGKTTRVPLALLEAGLTKGRILMLEPRRLAARAAAERMAATLCAEVGGTVGYRIRGEARVGRTTRIEVVTEGILTRMLQDDPGLAGVGAILFDEFHERSLNADLGLAFALEVRGALRDDLVLLPMSATLDAAPVAALMGGAPVITAEGRAFPVDLVHLDAPLAKGRRSEEAVADLIRRALGEMDGGVLAFLPGEAEIRRTAAALGEPGAGVTVHPLFGAMPFGAQRAAIAPAPDGKRKVVLATAIAETSLTIEGVGAVVDAGRARRARFDPRSGMSRLVTERVSRAEATQRAGRAGRLGPGRCYRLWTKGEEGALPAFPPAEIEIADLAPLALELALWGDPEGGALPFLTPPPVGALAEARALLESLGAVDAAGRVTDHGAALAKLPVHPRLGHMLLSVGRDAAPLAALLSERDPLRGAPVDARHRLKALRGDRDVPGEINRGALQRIRAEAKRLARLAPEASSCTPAGAAALAYPDRVGLRRPGDAPRWLLSGGKGAAMEPGDALAGQRLIVATDLDGDAREARIRMALPLTEAELRGLFADRIGWVEVADWSRRERRVVARRQERFGAVVLDDRMWRDAPPDALARAALEGVRDLGLPWSEAARRLQARALLWRAEGAEVPDLSDATLEAEAEAWLLPFLTGVRTADDIRRLDLVPALQARIGHARLRRLDAEMPPVFTSPAGRRLPIDYGAEAPEIAARVQEFFGTTEHPCVGPRRLPLRLVLLSPAGRPVQVTTDLPGFWAGSYADVARDMRARYPRHPWPDDPGRADPTLRAKRRS
jgi:ATP-dependent helicase HrpB